ncbi:MAG TPA: biotin-dependent carboxyltransferase family protein [Pyrinomonadaceae bacterium]|nr:biotin-dependent carboxyltransferase family protein [Pyrinomonadaceae bacterium]
MSIIIQSNSLLTTLQDLGRNGFCAFGINPNGAMDKTALRLINILLGNDENEAGLEIHFPAPKILFEKDAIIALGGADFGAKLDDKEIVNWQIIQVQKGQTLTFSRKNRGNRLYLSIKGGFEIKDWLNSKSTNLKAKYGGFEGRKLEKDDRIKFKIQSSKLRIQKFLKISPHFVSDYLHLNRIRIIAGPEFDLLTPLCSEILLKERFVISQNSDRMGYRLIGKELHLLHEKELVSSAVTFGTIQLLPNGQMIILMADHQTTGGYPRIGNVISVDLPILAQLGANDKVNFEIISLEDAEKLKVKFEKDLNLLKCGIKFKKDF